MTRFLLGHLLSGATGRYSHGEIRARRGFGFDTERSITPPPTEILKFKCKSCFEPLKFNAVTWLYVCPSCASSFTRGDFNQKADYLRDPECHTTRANYEAHKKQQENPTALNAVQLKCENCTGVLINNAAENMLKCPYCNSIYMKNG